MEVLCIQGSPRKQGNTATVLGWVEDELRAAGHQVERLDIVEMDIRGCMEDFACQKIPDRPGCSMEDDGEAVLQRILAADLVVLASPVFCWGFTAQMKALLDRCICLCKISDTDDPVYLMEGKPLALVSTAAGPKEGNMDIISEMFSRCVEYQRCRSAGQLLIPRCESYAELGEEIEASARAFGKRLAAGA
jgi:multimeric flavodoxin WrbA